MRVKFSLINSLGQEFEISNVITGMMIDVGGIGGAVSNTYSQLPSKWIRMKAQNSQGSISGSVIFRGADCYAKEALFTAFLRTSSGLKFKVITPATTKLIAVDVVSYELQAVGLNTLACPIKMITTSLWYSETVEKANIIIVGGNEARFPMTFPVQINDYSDGYVNIDNSGSIEANFTIEFYGEIDNPRIALEVNGSETAAVEIDTSITAAQRIFYSSKDGEIACLKGTIEQINAYKQNGTTTGLTNLALAFSLSNQNFFKLPVGNSALHITADSTLQNSIMISIYKYYRAI